MITVSFGPVVKVSTSRVADPEFVSRGLHGEFSWASHTSDLTNGTQVATLPDARRYMVCTGTGWPGFSIL